MFIQKMKGNQFEYKTKLRLNVNLLGKISSPPDQ